MIAINSIKNMSPDTDIIVLGDKVRYEFLKWFITGKNDLPLWENLPVVIRYNNSEQSIIKNNNDYWDITSYWITPNTNILILPDTEKFDLEDDKSLIGFDGIFLVLADVFRSLSNSVENAYSSLKKLNKNVKLCFVDLERKYASTDIDRDLSIVEEIVKKYSLVDSNYLVLKNKKDLFKIFPNYEDILSSFKRYGMSKINTLHEVFEDILFDLKYEIEDRSYDVKTTPDFLDSITSYRSIKESKNKYLWESYIDVSEKILFDLSNKKSFNFAVKSYMNFFYNESIKDLIFWNIEEDVLNIRKDFKALFIKKANEYQKNEKISKIKMPSNEPEYLDILSGTNNNDWHGINIKFHEFIDNFINNEIQNFIEIKINEKINIIKGFLK